MTYTDLPLVNACLNGLATLLLLIGRRQIKLNRRENHKKLMIAAFTCSILFLCSYLIYHYQVGSVGFKGTGWTRPVYFSILITHTILAVSVPILSVITLRRGLKSQFSQHVKIAKWTYPIWLYVSATGVIIYLFLYQWFPGS